MNIKELKKTTKGKAILKLIRWSIFFIIIFIFLIISSFINPHKKETSTVPNNREKEELNLNNLINKINNGYNYTYEITINDLKYIYRGTNSLKEDIGYKEYPEGVIKYVVDETGEYTLTTTGRTPSNNLYENINKSYLKPIDIINTLKSLNLVNISNNKYICSDNLNNYELNIISDSNIKLIIKSLNYNYDLNITF